MTLFLEVGFVRWEKRVSDCMILPQNSGFAISDLGFSPTDIAEIGARIARGEKKTEIVRMMKGYDARRHHEFAAPTIGFTEN